MSWFLPRHPRMLAGFPRHLASGNYKKLISLRFKHGKIRSYPALDKVYRDFN